MDRHPHFNILLHDNRELHEIACFKPAQRLTVHEWPLSCVQVVTSDGGNRLVYKSQYGPTVEPEFYQKAESPILPKTLTINREGKHASMLLEFIDAPLAGSLSLTGEQALKMSYEVTDLLRQIKGDPPVYLDLGTPWKFREMLEAAIFSLWMFIENGLYRKVTPEMIRKAEAFVRSAAVQAVYDRGVGLIHGDVNSGNVFVLPDCYKVIDWQRVKIAPYEIDNVAFMHSLGYDPADYLPQDVVNMFYLLTVRWFVECQTVWIVEGDYDEDIADLLSRIKVS